jgi:hypothetical protein
MERFFDNRTSLTELEVEQPACCLVILMLEVGGGGEGEVAGKSHFLLFERLAVENKNTSLREMRKWS